MAEAVFHLIKVAPTVIILELTERVMPDYFGLGLGTIIAGSLACDPPPLSLLSLFLVMLYATPLLLGEGIDDGIASGLNCVNGWWCLRYRIADLTPPPPQSFLLAVLNPSLLLDGEDERRVKHNVPRQNSLRRH